MNETHSGGGDGWRTEAWARLSTLREAFPTMAEAHLESALEMMAGVRALPTWPVPHPGMNAPQEARKDTIRKPGKPSHNTTSMEAYVVVGSRRTWTRRWRCCTSTRTPSGPRWGAKRCVVVMGADGPW